MEWGIREIIVLFLIIMFAVSAGIVMADRKLQKEARAQLLKDFFDNLLEGNGGT